MDHKIEEPSAEFALKDNAIRLHIELKDDFTKDQIQTLKQYGGVKYGNSVSRDILIPGSMRLHNLHYVIQVLFGFLIYHPHDFQLPQDVLEKLTESKAENWHKLIGVLFQDPLRNPDFDFWDDNYEGGSVKKYLRSKYTGPYDTCVLHESFQSCRGSAKKIRVGNESIDDLCMEFDNNPFELLGRLPVAQVLSVRENIGFNAPLFRDFDDYMAKEAEFLKGSSQPQVLPVTHELLYSYDYGDDWKFSITASSDVSNLIKDKRITERQIKQAVEDVCTLNRPVLLAADGYSLFEDVGGAFGYTEFLNAINGNPSDVFDYEWAQSLGWKAKLPTKNAL